MSTNQNIFSNLFGQRASAQNSSQHPFHQPRPNSAVPPHTHGETHQPNWWPQQNPYPRPGVPVFSPSVSYAPQEQRFSNSNKHFVRTSAAVFPSSANLAQKASVPIGAIISPMSPLGGEPPLVSHGNSMIIRCKKCRTYINPYIKIEGNGTWWYCNICGMSNETPEQYIHLLSKHLIGTGGEQPNDFSIALNNGSFEFIASADYMIRSPQPPTYLFVIDVSAPSLQSGLLEVVCNVIKTALKEKVTQGVHRNRTLVGIITYDSSVHFYNLNAANKNAKMYVIADLEDVFVPLPFDILVNLTESYNVIENLLDNLPNTFKDTKISGNCMGSAVNAAHLILFQNGGMLCIFTSLPPTLGDYFSKAAYKDSQTNPLLSTFKDVSVNLVRANIAVELFVCTSQSVDIASMQVLSNGTSGGLHYYPVKTHHYNEKLKNDLYDILMRETAWESVMRVRISNGWKIKHWFGHFHLRGSDLMVLPISHPNQTFSFNFEIQDNAIQGPIVCFQAALLYTTSNGERRIRVHNYALPVTDNYNDLISTLDPEACITLLCNESIQICKNAKLQDGRNFIQATCSKICQQQTSGLTEESRQLAIYCLGLLKSVALRGTTDVTPELRYYHWSRLQSLPPDIVALFCYPSLYPLHTVGETDNVTNLLPERLSLTHGNLSQEGAFLLEDGESMYMWIGSSINPHWLHSIFGTNTIENLHPESAVSYIGAAGTTLSTKVDNIIKTLRASRPSYMPLVIIRDGDQSQFQFYASLIEDKCQSFMETLNEFLAKLSPRAPLDYQSNTSFVPAQGMNAPASYAHQAFQAHPPQPTQHVSVPAGYSLTKKHNPPGPPPKL